VSFQEIAPELRFGFGADVGARRIVGVARDQGDRCRSEELDLLCAEGKAEIVDRGRDLVAGQRSLVLGLGDGLDEAGRGEVATSRVIHGCELEANGVLDADEPGKPLTQLFVGGELDEHGGRQLAGSGQEPVVDVELSLDALVGQDPLSSCHLLDLEADRVDGLEHEGHHRPERDASPGLVLDDPSAEVVAHALVGTQVQDVADVEGFGALTPAPRRCRTPGP